MRAEHGHDGSNDLPEDVLVLREKRQQEIHHNFDPFGLLFVAVGLLGNALSLFLLLLARLVQADVKVGQDVDGQCGIREQLKTPNVYLLKFPI